MKKTARLVLLVFVLTAIFCITTLSSNAAFSPSIARPNITMGVVNADNVNVRQGPGTNYPVVCVLKKGDKVEVAGKYYGWCIVMERGKNCVGVIAERYISSSNSPIVRTTPIPNTNYVPRATPMPNTNYIPKPVPTTVPAPQVPSVPKTQPTPQAPTGVSSEAQKLLQLCNDARAQAGAGPLQFDMPLMKCAQAKAVDMVNKNYFSHQSPTYGSPFDQMRQFGISFKTAGENIAGNQTVEATFDAWMKSEGHRANILNGAFNYVGFGIQPGSQYGKIWVQQFIGR